MSKLQELILQLMNTPKYTSDKILIHEFVCHAIPMLLAATGGSTIGNESTIRKELRLNEINETYNDSIVYYNANDKLLFMPNK